ncbi:MAG: thioredoxin-disulfide reductase [bacterium]
MENVIILGSGPAGLTAAIYAGRAGLKPLVIEGAEPGGQLTTTTEVENWPGEAEGIQGQELIANIRKQAEKFGTRFEMGKIIEADLKSSPIKLKTESKTFETRTLIIATGASAKWLGIESETRLRGHGVSACATCDGFFFKGKDIAVIGGGDAALEEATFLTKFASTVTIVVRSEALRGSLPMQERAKNNPKIKFIWNSEVVEILGDQAVTGIKLNNKDGRETTLPVGGVFVAIGHEPNTKIFDGQLELVKGYVVTKPGTTETSLLGVFAAGDVADWRYRQAITAAGRGCMAAIDAEKYLASQTE